MVPTLGLFEGKKGGTASTHSSRHAVSLLVNNEPRKPHANPHCAMLIHWFFHWNNKRGKTGELARPRHEEKKRNVELHGAWQRAKSGGSREKLGFVPGAAGLK